MNDNRSADRKIKIAYVIPRSDEIGGAHIHVRDLAIFMRSAGHEAKVFVGGDGIYCDILKPHCLAINKFS